MTDYDSLAAWAALKLAETKDPRVSYRIDAINLAAHSEVDFSFDALQIGSQIQVIDEGLGIDVKLRVVKIAHLDMLHPERIVVEVSNKVRDITDTITTIAGEV
jgi:phage minor structural protein